MAPFANVKALANIAGTLLVVLGAVCTFAQEPPLMFMADHEPAMKRAFELARAGLDNFLDISRRNNPEFVGHAVKVGIRDGKETEYFWISDFTQSSDRFSGKIDNTPQIVKNVRMGQIYEFSKTQIVDWLYIDRSRKKMVGNFTYCALLTKEPAERAAAARKRFNLDCDA